MRPLCFNNTKVHGTALNATEVFQSPSSVTCNTSRLHYILWYVMQTLVNRAFSKIHFGGIEIPYYSDTEYVSGICIISGVCIWYLILYLVSVSDISYYIWCLYLVSALYLVSVSVSRISVIPWRCLALSGSTFALRSPSFHDFTNLYVFSVIFLRLPNRSKVQSHFPK